MNLRHLTGKLEDEGHFAYNYNTGEFDPGNGYIVHINYAKLGYDFDKFNDQKIKDFINVNATALAQPNAYITGYLDENILWLDVSLIFEGLERALYVGIINNQKVIYDVVNHVEIELPTPQRTGTETQRKIYNSKLAEDLANNYLTAIS